MPEGRLGADGWGTILAVTSSPQRLGGVVLGLLVVVVIGASFVRFWDLDARGIGHVELYAPNIPLPPDVSDPPPRMTLVSTLTGSLWEPHPPAWYLANYPWTVAFGVSATALRVPSVVGGAFSVLLLWWYARRERSASVALVAAALVAANGLHIMWSQLSRPVIFVSAFGIASSLVLLRLVASPSPARLAWYLALSLAGVATDHYYWFLLGGQFVWVFLLSRTRPAFAGLVDWQLAAMAAASPFITLAIGQSRESYLGAGLLETTLNYAAFGFLFQAVESTYRVASWLPPTAIGLGLLLAVVGFARSPSVGVTASAPIVTPGKWLLLVTAGSMAAIVVVAYVLASAGIGKMSRMLVTMVLPPLFLALATLVRHVPWPRLLSTPTLSVILCTVPVATVFAVSTVMPLVDTKYFLLFTPFLLLQIAEGIVTLLHSPKHVLRVAGAAAVVLAAVLHWASWQLYRGVDSTPIDYRALAAQVMPALDPNDRVLVFKHYAMTGLFYYLRLDPSRFVGFDHADVRKNGASRFWLISLRDTQVDDPPGYAQATTGCELTQTVTARRIRAELFDHCPSR